MKTYDEAITKIDNLIFEGYKNVFGTPVDLVKETVYNIFHTDYSELSYRDELHITFDEKKMTYNVMPRRINKVPINFGGNTPWGRS